MPQFHLTHPPYAHLHVCWVWWRGCRRSEGALTLIWWMQVSLWHVMIVCFCVTWNWSQFFYLAARNPQPHPVWAAYKNEETNTCCIEHLLGQVSSSPDQCLHTWFVFSFMSHRGSGSGSGSSLTVRSAEDHPTSTMTPFVLVLLLLSLTAIPQVSLTSTFLFLTGKNCPLILQNKAN